MGRIIVAVAGRRGGGTENTKEDKREIMLAPPTCSSANMAPLFYV